MMETTVEETAKHTVRLEVEVPPEEFARDLDRAYRKLAGEVKIASDITVGDIEHGEIVKCPTPLLGLFR